MAASDVAFQVEDLLPSPQEHLSVSNGHSEGRPEQGGLQMGVAVAIVPGAFVPIVAAGRNQLIQNDGQVALQPRLKFNCSQGARAPDMEDVDGAGSNPRIAHRRRDPVREVVHVAMTLGRESDLLLMNHSQFYRGTAAFRISAIALPER